MDLEQVCSICSDSFNEKTKRSISCPYCAAESCFGCMKKCALLWASDPKCAHCSKKLEPSFIDAVFPKGFRRGQLRIQAIKNLLEQEMSLLPQSSIRFQEIKLQERIASLYTELRHLTEMMRTSPYLKFPLKRLAEIEDSFKDCQANNKKTIVRKTTKCPTEDCRGYIPSGLKCPICQVALCSDCNAAKISGSEHSCSIEDISSWAAIKDSTVPCPKCSMRIEKISGCNQMWCTIKDCNTAFDWATGKIINGPMHNPHYHEYLRTLAPLANNQEDHIACQTPRNKLSNARINEVYYFFRAELTSKLPDATIMTNFIQANLEAFDYERPIEEYGPQTYEKLRFEYLDSKITKEQWASRLSCKETLRIKKKKLHELKQLYQTAASEIFATFYLQNKIKFMASQTDTFKPDLQALENFNNQNEALRQLYSKELKLILADYSDTHAKILDRNGQTIRWTNTVLT